MKIRIFGDSFGLPRFFKQSGYDYDNFGKSESGKTIELHYEDTYPEKLRQSLMKNLPGEDVVLLNHCAPYHNSFHLITDFKTAYLHQPDYVVVQVGIVDSSPRKETDFTPFPFMKGKNPWVSPDEFKQNLLTFIKLCLVQLNSLKSMILVNIVKTSENHNQRHTGMRENTKAYNQIIAELCRLRAEKERDGKKHFVDVLPADMFQIVEIIGEKALCADGVHINAIGSQSLANVIAQQIVSNYKKPDIKS